MQQVEAGSTPEGSPVDLDKAYVRLLTDAYIIEGTIHVPPNRSRVSDAIESLITDSRTFVPVTDARVTTTYSNSYIDSPGFIQVKKSVIRAIYQIDPTVSRRR